MGLLTLYCGIAVAFTGLASGAGVLPDSVNAAVGDTVMFSTSLTPTQTPFIVIAWAFGTENIISSNSGGNFTAPEYEGRITLFISTGSLQLRNVALSDTGEYRVNIIPAAGPQLTGFITLNVYEPVSNVSIRVNSSDLVEFNSSVTLSCSADGTSPKTFLWFNGTSEVTASDRVRLTDGGANLTIVTVWRYDQGPFRCKVSNPVSSSTSDPAELSISYGPDDVILRTPPIDYCEEGSDVLMSCSADSRPAAHFKWLLNGELLSFIGAQLELVNIQMSQSGNYSCQAFNNKTLRSTISQPALISVLKRITNIDFESSSNEPIEGSSVNISCDASGSIFTRKWLINGQDLKPSENIVFYEQNRVLSFKVLNRKDSESYVCEISNPINTQTAVYSLDVNYGPENVQVSGPNEIQVDKTLKLSCFSDSVPTANSTWIKNGTILSQSSEYTKDFTGSSDSGEYICRATNDITKKTSEASHTVFVKDSTTPPPSSGCNTGCIVGIVIGCIVLAVVVLGGVFYVLRKKNLKKQSTAQRDGGSHDNSAYAQSQEVNYVDVRFFKRGGGVVHLPSQNQTEYAEVQKNKNQRTSRLPNHDDHMTRGKRPAPSPPTAGTEYAEIRRK